MNKLVERFDRKHEFDVLKKSLVRWLVCVFRVHKQVVKLIA